MASADILVVDDDRNIRETLGDILSLEGYHVLFAENGEQALDLIRHGPPPAVILLDLMMPVMSGWEFLELAETDQELRRLPVIVVSAMPAPLASEDEEGGVKGWIGKPVDFDRLLELVGRVEARRPDRSGPPMNGHAIRG